MQRKRILLVRTGGTIESTSKNGKRIHPSKNGTIDQRFLDDLEERFNIRIASEMPLIDDNGKKTLKDSAEVGYNDWKRISRCIVKNMARRHIDGVVVTSGTDTMPFISSALTFMLPGLRIPVIVTGSEIRWDKPESDGPRNLANSIKAAVELDYGAVFLFFGSRLLFGCRAFKMHSGHQTSFESPNYPKIGEISGDGDLRIFPFRGRSRFHYSNVGDVLFDEFRYPSVFVATVTPDSSPDFLCEVKDSGILVSAYGLGNLPKNWRSVITDLSTKVPIAITTHSPKGGVRPNVYEVGAPDTSISCNDMTFPCAVIKFRHVLGVVKKEFSQFKPDTMRAIIKKEMEKNWHGELTSRK